MYMELLSPSERKSALSMDGEKLQKVAVLSRALVRTTLSRCTKPSTTYRILCCITLNFQAYRHLNYE
jgi:hypothetical protein